MPTRLAPGKSQDVIQILPGMVNGKLGLLDGGAEMRPEALVRFKREVVDPLMLTEPYKSQLKELGFTAIQLKIASRSDSFPKGTWDIPIQ